MGTVQLRAPMQGTIVSVEVVVGQQVRAGQQVMLIESMKMHHAIEADASGAIDALLVEVGQTVAEGEPVAMLAPGEVTVVEVVEAVDDDPDRIRPDLAETLARHRFGHDEARPDAVARLKRTLALGEVAKQEGITVEKDGQARFASSVCVHALRGGLPASVRVLVLHPSAVGVRSL